MDDPWDVDASSFPRQGDSSAQLRALVRFAVLAPSSHNTQPWLFRIREDVVELHADRTRALPVVDPIDRALVISCGAALGHLCAAARGLGLVAEVALLPDPEQPDLLAIVRIAPGPPPTEDEEGRLAAIPRRRSNRSPFEPRPIPAALLARLEADASAEGASLEETSETPSPISSRRGIASRRRAPRSVASSPRGSTPTGPAAATACPASPTGWATSSRCSDRS